MQWADPKIVDLKEKRRLNNDDEEDQEEEKVDPASIMLIHNRKVPMVGVV